MHRIISQISIGILLMLMGLGCDLQEETNDFESRMLPTQYEEINLVTLFDGLDYPWSMAFLPDNRMLITELPGRLNILDLESGELTRVSGLPDIGGVPEEFQTHPVRVQGQEGGLTEVSLHPDYEENGWIYITYTKASGELDQRGRDLVALAMGRGQLEGDNFVNYEELFVQNRFQAPGRHYGSRIAWTHDGKLLLSLGGTSLGPREDGRPSWPQDLQDHAGKVLRFNDDGTVPDDNPFVGREDVLPEIYAYGFRNIQGMMVHPETGEIWTVEHGPRGGDELNLVEAGNNYGWPLITPGVDYGTQGPQPGSLGRWNVEGFTDPVYEFQPGQAPSGITVVTSDNFPNWQGNFLIGGLRSERIRRLLMFDYEGSYEGVFEGEYDGRYEVAHDEELLLKEIGRIRDVREGPDGFIYVLRELPGGDVTIVSDEGDGTLYRIEPYEN